MIRARQSGGRQFKATLVQGRHAMLKDKACLLIGIFRKTPLLEFEFLWFKILTEQTHVKEHNLLLQLYSSAHPSHKEYTVCRWLGMDVLGSRRLSISAQRTPMQPKLAPLQQCMRSSDNRGAGQARVGNCCVRV